MKNISAFICLMLACSLHLWADTTTESNPFGIPDGYKEVLAIVINDIDRQSVVESKTGKSAVMLSFGGFCNNEFFKGKVLPGGFDCQRDADGMKTLSARYVLEGVDGNGDSCRIFIENNAIEGNTLSKPVVTTDSRELAFLNTSDLIGVLDTAEPFTIRIFALDTAMAASRELKIPGSKGLLAATLERPSLVPGQKCPIVILCHGFGGSRNGGFLEDIAHELPRHGIATIRFDFNGHGDSDGLFRDMTVPNEIDDAKAIYQYVSTLPFVDTSKISVAGHSQGGVVAAMLAGELGHERLHSVVLLCAAAVLRDDCIRGNTFGKQYNPLDPPEAVDLGGGKQLGREYIKTAFSLPIYETAQRYHGPACIVHGTADRIVPYTYSLRFRDILPGSEYHQLPGLDHGFGPNPQAAVDIAVDYLRRSLSDDKK